MTKNSSKLLFILMMIMGTMITISANSWLSAWMGLEMNLLAFIPMMSNIKNMMTNESALKYFMVQAMASSVLLLSIILLMMHENSMSQLMNNNMIMLMMNSSLMLSSGVAPLHFWFPGVMEGLSWINALILMTWQKIAPMVMINYSMVKELIILFTIMSIMVGSLGGVNQTSLRKLMAFSSINHMGWMLMAMLSQENMWLFYFSMYSILSTSVVMVFKKMEIYHFNQIHSSQLYSKIMKFLMYMNLLSLGGLPPFTGFIPKWLVMQQLISDNQMFMMIMMVTFTLITLFFYLRMTFTSLMLNTFETNWVMGEMNKSLSKQMMIMSFMSISGLPLISLIYMMI